jgi:hypothetical protein
MGYMLRGIMSVFNRGEFLRSQRPKSLFVNTNEQIANVIRWNEEFNWGFTEDDFEKLEPPPAWPLNEMICVVLVPYLQTVQFTLEALWDIAKKYHPMALSNQGFCSDPQKLYLCGTVEHHPGLRWEVIDLGSNFDAGSMLCAQEQMPIPEQAPHAGVLAVAAHCPNWVSQIDDRNIPSVWIPGYIYEGRLSIDDQMHWRQILSINYLKGGTSLPDSPIVILGLNSFAHRVKGRYMPRILD